MANTWINETENDSEEFKLHVKTSKNVLHLGTSYIIFKVSKKSSEETQELFGLRKGEREKHKERTREILRERKKKGQKQLKQT